MIDIVIPGSVAYETLPDPENPWGSSEWFRDEIAEWLDKHAGSRGWDHDINYETNECTVSIEDKKIALLFKLTWGGHGL